MAPAILNFLEAYQKLASLVMNTSIQFDLCDLAVTVSGNETKYSLKANWPGKSISDWQNNVVLVEGV